MLFASNWHSSSFQKRKDHFPTPTFQGSCQFQGRYIVVPHKAMPLENGDDDTHTHTHLQAPEEQPADGPPRPGKRQKAGTTTLDFVCVCFAKTWCPWSSIDLIYCIIDCLINKGHDQCHVGGYYRILVCYISLLRFGESFLEATDLPWGCVKRVTGACFPILLCPTVVGKRPVWGESNRRGAGKTGEDQPPDGFLANASFLVKVGGKEVGTVPL